MYYHYDGRGDVVATTTQGQGRVLNQTAYSAFGEHNPGRFLLNGMPSPAAFGVEQDSSQVTYELPQRGNTKEEEPMGLLNDGHRYRDYLTGRFLTKDPAGFVDGPNLYAYVNQNPWTKFDPEGLADAPAQPNSQSPQKNTRVESPPTPTWGQYETQLIFNPEAKKDPSKVIANTNGKTAPDLVTAGTEALGVAGMAVTIVLPGAKGSTGASDTANIGEEAQITASARKVRASSESGASKVTAPAAVTKTLTDAVGSVERRQVVTDVVAGRRPLSDLTTAERQAAATFYRQTAGQTKGSLKEAAEKFNQLRANYLEGKTKEVPGTINDFITRNSFEKK